MEYTVKIYSETEGEIEKFLNLFYQNNFEISNNLFWKKEFDDPTQIIDILSAFIDNKDKFNANIWISLDKDIFICVTENNLNDLIKYIYERFPY